MTAVMSRLRPDDSSRSRHPSAGGPTDTPGIALLPIAADLLPRETTADRRSRKGRLVALTLVAVTVLAVAGGWLLSVHARSGAATDLAAAQDRQRSLTTTQRGFDELVTTKATATALRDQLATLMATDTPWSTLLTELGTARGGVTFTSVQAAVADPSVPTAAASTTPGAIGTVSISGTAIDKPTVAAFVEALGGLTGLADPFLSSVSELSAGGGDASGGGYTFTVQVQLTDDLRAAAPGRFATTTGGGK